MAFSLIPDRVYSSIFEIDGTELSRHGVSLLLADLDNTLAKYGQPDPEPAVQQWKCGLAEAGVELFLLSNSRKPTRAGHYARCLEVPYLGHAGKPRTEGFFRAMEQMGRTPTQTAIDVYKRHIQYSAEIKLWAVILTANQMVATRFISASCNFLIMLVSSLS